MINQEKMRQLLLRYEELQILMTEQASGNGREFVKMSQEYSTLEPIVQVIKSYQDNLQDIADLQQMMSETDDPVFQNELQKEYRQKNEHLEQQEKELQILLIPRDKADDKSAILEIRAGTGGQEAALFASELLRMYMRYTETRNWQTETISENISDLGGIKEIIVAIKGFGVFERLKFESGVHRVQRIPQTESGGRIHTSAATVAVMPEAEDVDITINDEDIRIDVFRASGAGGQHVNRTESAVRITHLPSGIVVSQQDEKSQHKNKARAMKILRSRLYDLEYQKLSQERSANRRSQVGSGDRSERIRTYNYPQGRVTDHRINLTLYKLDTVLNGENLDDVIDPLLAADRANRLLDNEG